MPIIFKSTLEVAEINKVNLLFYTAFKLIQIFVIMVLIFFWASFVYRLRRARILEVLIFSLYCINVLLEFDEILVYIYEVLKVFLIKLNKPHDI